MTYYIGIVPITPYLEHFGILGMKWGVRRYQNEDGTRTEAGKQRYGAITGIKDRISEKYNREKEIERRYRKAISDVQRKKSGSSSQVLSPAYNASTRRKNGIKGYYDPIGTPLKITGKAIRNRYTREAIGIIGKLALSKLPINSQTVAAYNILNKMTKKRSMASEYVWAAIMDSAVSVPIQSLLDEREIKKKYGIDKKEIAKEYDREHGK